jgi:mannose-6-phosphate isomerase
MQKYTEERPWGKFEQFTKNESTTVKIITVNAGQSLSLQYHKKRAEFWRIISGEGLITVGNKSVLGKNGDEFFISPGENHRVKAGDESEVTFLEISTGDFDENDIVRLEDKYGRV